jgi:hypothetical protein
MTGHGCLNLLELMSKTLAITYSKKMSMFPVSLFNYAKIEAPQLTLIAYSMQVLNIS